MMRRSVIEAVGGYAASLQVSQDFDLWVRVLRVGKIHNLPGVLTHRTVKADSISIAKRRRQIATTMTILARELRRSGRREIAFGLAVHGLKLAVPNWLRRRRFIG